MARVTRHQRPHVGAVGSVGTGKASLRTSSSAAAVTLGRPAPGDAQPDQPDPVGHGDGQSEPAGPAVDSAPNQMKTAVAISCQTMFWNASSPAIQPEVKLRTVKGSRRIGR